MTGSNSKGPIYVFSDHHFGDRKIYATYVWLAAKRVSEMLPGRASWSNALDLIYEYADRLYFEDGTKYDPIAVNEVFPDPQNRWMTDFLKADETGRGPAYYSWQHERLRMIELYCRLRNDDPWPFPPIDPDATPPAAAVMQQEMAQ
ncbi:hypothetical protein LP7551_04177 [Roseibium album]|nr:hypothetical protein LP7551_04177 [Roseibium album]